MVDWSILRWNVCFFYEKISAVTPQTVENVNFVLLIFKKKTTTKKIQHFLILWMRFWNNSSANILSSATFNHFMVDHYYNRGNIKWESLSHEWYCEWRFLAHFVAFISLKMMFSAFNERELLHLPCKFYIGKSVKESD